MSNRRGFTLVELLVVAVVGSLLVMAAYQVLITNQKTYTIQNSKVQAQQNTRAAMEILFNELREISGGGGDIIDFGEQKLDVRTMRKIGVVCDNNVATFGGTPQLLVRTVADGFAAGDSVFVFADNDEYKTSDDTWFGARVTAVTPGLLCEGTYDAQLIAFSGQSSLFVSDTVRGGAPVRSFTRYTYALDTYDGDVYLGRAESGGDWVPLVGPLNGTDAAPGLTMTYFDANGEETGDVTDVRRVVITVRSFGDATDNEGHPVVDSLTTSIYMRN